MGQEKARKNSNVIYNACVNITILLDKKFIHIDQRYQSTFLTTKFGWDHTDLSLLKQKVMDTPDDINDFRTSKPAAWKLVSVTPIDLLTILLSGFHYHIIKVF